MPSESLRTCPGALQTPSPGACGSCLRRNRRATDIAIAAAEHTETTSATTTRGG